MKHLLISLFALAVLAIPVSAQAESFAQLDSNATRYLINTGILEAELDGNLALSATVTRAQFVEAVVDYAYPNFIVSENCFEQLDSNPRPGVDFTHLFKDVSKEAPYALKLCHAMRAGLVWGYADGTFRPNNTISFAEAAKIINIAFGTDYVMPDHQDADWYENYVYTIGRHAVLPTSLVQEPEHVMTGAETVNLLRSVSASMATHHGSTVDPGNPDSLPLPPRLF